MRFNSGSSIKNNAYSSSSASSNTNEKLKKLNEELDQLELLVSGMQTSLSSVNSKVGTDTVSSQIAAAKTEIENAIGQEVVTQKVTAPEAKLDVITSDTIHTDYISTNENDSIDILNGIKVPNIKLSDSITSVSTNDNVRVPANAIAWIGSNLVVNKGNGNALIFSETGDISYHFAGNNILIHPTETVNVSFIYRSTPVDVIPHQSYEYTSVNSGLTVVGPFYADLTAATFQNITVSGEINVDLINAENIDVSQDVNVRGMVNADEVASNSADIKEIESDTITSDRINSSQIHTKIDKENIGYTTVQEHQDTEEYAIGIPITNGLWEIELEGYIKATIDKTNSAVLITYWRDSESALTRVGVKDGVFYFYTRRSGKLYFSNNTLEVNDTTVSVNAPNDPGYPIPETLDKEINIVTNEGAIATETMVVDNLIVTGDLTIKDFVADKVAVRITDEDQDFNVTFTAPLPDPEQEEVSNNYIYGDSDLTYNPTTNTLGTGNIKVEKDITLVDSVDAETEEVTYSSGEAYQYLSVSCEADGETLRAHWEDAATTISCENPKLTSSQTIAAYNGKTAENKYPITHLGTCTTLHGNMGDGYLCLEDARLYSPALYAGANTVCKLMVDGICNPKIYDRSTSKCHDVASWVCEAPATSTWNSMVCNNGVCKKLTTTDHVKAACVTACDTVLACCHLVTCGDLAVAGEASISCGLCANTVTANCFCGKATCADIADNSTCFNGCTYSQACTDIRNGLATQTCADAIQDCANFIQNCVSAIEEKIPTQASSSNQLADKDFVNSSITTNTANFRGTYACVAELPSTGNTNNDYAFICSLNTTTGNYIYDRYKWVASGSCWVCEYELNTTGFTAEQLASINSGITSNLVSKITDVYDNTVTVCMNGVCKCSFSLNQNTDSTINLGCDICNAKCFNGCTYACAKADIRNYTPSLATCATNADNSTCFGGCTYECAKADILSGNAATATLAETAKCVCITECNANEWANIPFIKYGFTNNNHLCVSDCIRYNPSYKMLLVEGGCICACGKIHATGNISTGAYVTAHIVCSTSNIYASGCIYASDCIYSAGCPVVTTGNIATVAPGYNCTGTVTQVKVGTTAYNPVSGVISLPAYPTIPTTIQNATCFNGCTYAQACSNIRSGLTSCTGTVTSVNVSVNGCSGSAVTSSGTVTLTNVPTCRIYKTMATANANRNVLLGEASETAGYGCVYVGNSCKLTFNPATGVLCAKCFCGSVTASGQVDCAKAIKRYQATTGECHIALFNGNTAIDNACTYVSNACKLTFNPATGVLCADTFCSYELCTDCVHADCVITEEIEASSSVKLGAECDICIYDICGNRFICGYNYSLAIGYNSDSFIDSNYCRIIVGLDNHKCGSGNYDGCAVVTGFNNKVCWTNDDYLSLIYGSHSTTRDGGLAIGGWNTAHGECSVVLGWDSHACECGTAIGIGAYADASGSIAIGCDAQASYPDSIAIGWESYSCCACTISIGHWTCSNTCYGLAIGHYSHADTYGTACVNSSIRKGALREITVTWCDSTLKCDLWKAIACNIDLRKNGKGTVLTSGCTYLSATGYIGCNEIPVFTCNYNYNSSLGTMCFILISNNNGDDVMTISAVCTSTASYSGSPGGGFLTITGWAK